MKPLPTYSLKLVAADGTTPIATGSTVRVYPAGAARDGKHLLAWGTVGAAGSIQFPLYPGCAFDLVSPAPAFPAATLHTTSNFVDQITLASGAT